MAIGTRLLSPYVGTFDPTNRFATSWILSPALLFGFRALLSLYAFATLFTIFGWNGSHGRSEESRHSFSFFTNLTYWGLAFYEAFAAIHTASYWLTGTPLLARWPKALQIAHSMFYSTIVIYPFIVTIHGHTITNYGVKLISRIVVYWALLKPGHFPSTFFLWSNTSQHALNSAYALFEIIVPRTSRLPWLDLIPTILILALYLALAFLTYATDGFYVYPFLDLQKNSSGFVGGMIVGILVVAIIIFVIVRYLIVLRVWVTEKKLGRAGKFTTRRSGALMDDEAENGIQLKSNSAR